MDQRQKILRLIKIIRPHVLVLFENYLPKDLKMVTSEYKYKEWTKEQQYSENSIIIKELEFILQRFRPRYITYTFPDNYSMIQVLTSSTFSDYLDNDQTCLAVLTHPIAAAERICLEYVDSKKKEIRGIKNNGFQDVTFNFGD